MYYEGLPWEAHQRAMVKTEAELIATRENFSKLETRTKEDYDDYNAALIYLKFPWLRQNKE